MCLFASTVKAKKAESKIVCYKSVYSADDYDPRYGARYFKSAFKRFLYEGGRTYFEQSFSDRAPDRMVDRGFHSYRYQIDAERNSSHSHYPANVVLRCEIPAGSRYYTEWGNGGGCLCSDFLRVTGWKKPGADEPWHDTPGPMCGRLRVRWVRIIYKLFSVNKLK